MPYWLRAVLFVAAMLALTLGTSFHVHRRVGRAFALSLRGRWTLGAVLGVGPALLLISRRAEAWIGAGACGLLGVAGSIIVLATIGSSIGLAIAQALGWLRSRLARDRSVPNMLPAPAPVDPEPVSLAIGRRELLRRASVGVPVAAALGASAYGALFGRHDYAIEEIAVRIDGLRPGLDGYRIAQLSDLHFGVFCGAPERRAAVELLRRARPDLVVLTGDLVDNDVVHTAQVGRLVRELAALRPRDGVVVIGGNHDYYAGLEQVLEAARRGGARVLRNEGVAVAEASVALLGLDDVWGARYGWGPGPDLSAALAGLAADLPRVVLSHNPTTFADTAGRIALQLSGHTHGGQLAVAGYPAGVFLPYVRGLYRERGSYLYVNRGFGVAGPAARIGAPPELTIITLRS